MSLNPKSPLLNKRAMDALLESMTTNDYDSLGAHRRGESTPEAKGTELDDLNGEGFSGSPIVIPSKDLAPPASPEDAEFFKESQPKIGASGILQQMAKMSPEQFRNKYVVHYDLRPGGADRVESMMQGIQHGMAVSDIDDSDLRGTWNQPVPARAPIRGWHAWSGTNKAGTHAYVLPRRAIDKECTIKPGMGKPVAHVVLTKDGQTVHQAIREAADTGEGKKEARAVAPIEKDKAEHEFSKRGGTLYHATFTNKVPSIKRKGILPLQTSNWVRGKGGERYGGGFIFACDNAEDAVRWAGKMDWHFNQGMGTGKISIVTFVPGQESWVPDDADPLSQSGNKGEWLKAQASVKPEQITGTHVLTPEMVKSVIQNKGVAFKKEADVPTKSYGMGTPIGGTDNPDAGASDEPEELQDPGELALNMTSSEDDDPYDYEAEDARIAALMDEEDCACDSQARLWASEVDGNDWHVAMAKISSTDDSGWFAKSARPSEQKVELLQKQFRLTPEQLEECIKADPSPNQSDFVAWLAKYLAKGAIRLPEDSEKMKEQLGMFQKFKKSPAFTFNKDIQQYDPPKLFETLEQASASGMGSKKEEKREKVRQGADIVVKNGDVTIYKVTSAAAAAELGGGTNWCTAALRSGYAATYLKQGPLYIFFDAGSAVAQLHCESNQFMNRADVCMLESVTGENDYSEKFLADPSLAKALGLLAEKEPNVKEWVAENVANPEAVANILGEASQKEIEHNTRFDEEVVEYEKDLAGHPAALAQYEKDLAEYYRKQEAFKQSPEYKKWQQEYDAYEAAYQKWRENGGWSSSEDRPEAPQEPEGPEEPREPSEPRHPSEDRYNYGNGGYRERWTFWEPRGKKFTMQVRHALSTGKPLAPEIEQQLVGARVNTDLLLKYGALFHPGQPWEPLEKAIFAKVQQSSKVDKEAIDYAAKFIKGRWPALEPYLLEKLFLQTRGMENMRTALDYAARAYKARWPEFEAKLMKAKPGGASGYGAAEYAIRVLKQPWSAIPGIKRKKNGRCNPEECMIVGSPGEARRYAEAFFQGKSWNDFQRSSLEANNLAALINYAADTLHARMPELEEKILSGQRDAQESKGRERYRHYTDLPLEYSKKVIKGRWPEYEQKMLGYAKNTTKQRGGYSRDEYKPSVNERWGNHNRLDNRIANYIKQVIKGRWSELEQVLLARYSERPEQWIENQHMLDGYLVTLNETCQERLKDNRPVPDEVEDTGEEDALGRITRKPDERKTKSFTNFKQDAQCYWPEGEQRLVTRDPGYEKALTDELRKRATGADDEKEDWTKDEKFVSFEDLMKMEKPEGETSYAEQRTKPDWTIWNGLWIGWYGMDRVEKYVDYMLANNATWKEGVDIMEIHEDLEDVRGRWSFRKRPQRRQPEMQFQSSLLKKALVEINETPTKLPPRDDIKGHMDQQEQDLLTKGVMQGVHEPLNPKRKVRRPQINPMVNPDGVVASKEAAKTADYSQQDWEHDEDTRYQLDQAEDAKDEAKRHFMQESYLQQIAQEDGVTMDELWDDMGDEYTAEFYGYPYKRVPDFTDQEAPSKKTARDPLFSYLDSAWGARERPDDRTTQRIGQHLHETGKASNLPSGTLLAEKWRESKWPQWHPGDGGFLQSVGIRASGKALKISDVLDEGEIRIRFNGKEEVYPVAGERVMEAVEYAENLSKDNPGSPVVFIIDEGGCVTEDTYVDGAHVGDTVEKFAFRRAK